MQAGFVTIDSVDLNELWYAAVQGVDTYQEVQMPILSQLIRYHDMTLFKYGLSERNGYQIIGLDTRPDHRRVAEAAMYAPLPTKFAYGVGAGLDSIRLMTGRQIRMAIDRGFKEDPESMIRQILKVLMTDPGTNNAGYGLFNGQFAAEEKITAPPAYQMNTFAANHNHYYTAAAFTLEVITAGKQTIRHHGAGGTIAGLVNSDMVRQFENLAAWTANPRIPTKISDMVAVLGIKDQWTQLGVEWFSTEMIPDDYILMVEVSGVEDQRPIVQFEPPNLRGLRLMPGPMNDYPIVESFFERFAGWKIWKRGAGVCIQITADPTYTSPSFD